MKTNGELIKIHRLTSKILGRSAFQLGGSLANPGNRVLIEQAIRAWVSLPLELVSNDDEWSQYMSRLGNTLNALPILDFTDLISSFNAGYYCIIDADSTLRDFKDHVTAIGWRCLSIIHPYIIGWYDSKTNPELLRTNVTILRFLNKMSFEMDSLQEEALSSFLETEQRISNLDLRDNPYVDELQSILKMWLKDFRIDVLPVRHGSGSVAEGSLSKADKYKSLSYDKLLELQLNFACPNTLEHYFPFGARFEKFERSSRVKFVPKTATKLRTICMEPCNLQYFQQGVMREMYDYISRHRFLSTRIVLNDQTQNQEAAKFGSMLNNYATIDLSAASDSVSWALVKRLFTGTKFLSWAAATRSSHNTLPDGTVIKSSKFAPMGSALCFPTECLVFCAVVELVARRHDYTVEGRNSYSFYTVYGDDIACPNTWTEEVTSVLTSLGFLVNDDKSYSYGAFRESCGKEYYQGFDITPIYYRLDAINQGLTETDFVKLCSAANNAAEHGYTYLRSHYVNNVINTKKVNLPKGHVDKPAFTECRGKSPMIFSSHPTNFHLTYKWDGSYQVGYWNYLTVSSRDDAVEAQIVEDTINYFEFLVESRLRKRSLLEPVIRSVVPKRVRWTRARIFDHFM